MHAIILAGGAGTRLQGRFPDKMKALVPILDKPFIEWQMEWLAQSGIRQVHIAGGLYSDQLKEWADTQSLDMTITFSVEPSPLGTGGALAYAARFIDSGPAFCINGDTLLPGLNLTEMQALLSSEPDFNTIIAVTKIDDAARFGTVKCQDNKVLAFEEKKVPGPGLVNGGVYLIDPAALQAHAPESAFSLEKELFPQWAAAGKIGCIQAPPPLLDMGTEKGYTKMVEWLKNKRHQQQ